MDGNTILEGGYPCLQARKVEYTLKEIFRGDPNYWTFKNVSGTHHIKWISKSLQNGILVLVTDGSYHTKPTKNMGT